MLGVGVVRAGGNTRFKKHLQCGEIIFLGSGDEGIETAPSLGRTHERGRLSRDTLPGASDELAGVRFTESKDVRDLAIRVVESFTENVRDSFPGRESLQQQQDGTLQRFAPFRSQFGVGAVVHRLREPGRDIRFAAQAGGLGEVDGQSRRRRRQVCRCVQDDATISTVPPQPHVLQNVLGLGRASERSVRNRE